MHYFKGCSNLPQGSFSLWYSPLESSRRTIFCITKCWNLLKRVWLPRFVFAEGCRWDVSLKDPWNHYSLKWQVSINLELWKKLNVAVLILVPGTIKSFVPICGESICKLELLWTTTNGPWQVIGYLKKLLTSQGSKIVPWAFISESVPWECQVLTRDQ